MCGCHSSQTRSIPKHRIKNQLRLKQHLLDSLSACMDRYIEFAARNGIDLSELHLKFIAQMWAKSLLPDDAKRKFSRELEAVERIGFCVN